jgi:hypothetical protein
MTDRKITHEVKLQKSVIVILAVLAIGVLANAFAPALDVRSAWASSSVQMIAICDRKAYRCIEPRYPHGPTSFSWEKDQ